MSRQRQMKGCHTCCLCFWDLIFCVMSMALYSSQGDILTEERTAIKLGKAATLKCTLLKQYDVLQVTWQKSGSPLPNIATYSSTNGVNVIKDYRDHLNFTLLGLNETAITLWRTSVQDEGCYLCIFNTYPLGSIHDTTCLSVYEQLLGSLQYTISDGQLNATCIATGWPAAILSWPKMEKRPSKSSKMENANGTVTVTSWVAVNDSQSFLGTELVCRAQQNQEEFFYRKVVGKTSGLNQVSIALIVTAVSLSVLVVTLLVVYCVKHSRM
ncbi:OX-2 membrane glycoprotein [Microcaecilia unicolor]|uniref:OX-2 membrane glycoprotein n=1 Tax=Microcaecilia unicolor TaxID=1415580 RepID=A0A6P7XVR8_9AMPH|nr:OX-2 membrane glycoprotein [Microcaecilia unicolor]XP_030059537.1 OX-2 membrane glycoprotein [Microcaecilia unicolor]